MYEIHCRAVFCSFQVDEPWRPTVARWKPKHAAPGAFEVPPELLTSPAQSEVVVGIVQDGLNRSGPRWAERGPWG